MTHSYTAAISLQQAAEEAGRAAAIGGRSETEARTRAFRAAALWWATADAMAAAGRDGQAASARAAARTWELRA